MAKTILIIEDEIAIQNILAEPLRACGYEVVTASDGLEGINAFHTHHIDLILLDIMLPKINGYAVCEMRFTSPKNFVSLLYHMALKIALAFFSFCRAYIKPG